MFGVILLPDFALQAALRHHPAPCGQKSVAILDQETTKPVILQRNAAAAAAGVTAGMTSSQGLARCPALRLMR